MYAALTASVFKKVISEILMFVEDQHAVAHKLSAQDKGEVVNKFKVGS